MALQLHSGYDLQGEIQIAGASGVAGELLSCQGPGAPPAWAASSPGIWTLFETLSPAGVVTIPSSALPLHDLWMVIIDLEITEVGETQLQMRLNGDAGNNYFTRYFDDAVIVQGGALSAYILGGGTAPYGISGIVHIQGKRKGTGNNIGIYGGAGAGYPFNYGLAGYYAAAANLSGMTFLGPTMTGKIKIYWMDY